MSPQHLTDDRITRDLIAAILAVNGWTIAKVYAISDGLQREALFDLAVIKSIDVGELAQKLHAAGYTRGDFMCALLANRLQSFSTVFDTRTARALEQELRGGRQAEADRLLLSLHGVGPAVLRNFKILTGLEE